MLIDGVESCKVFYLFLKIYDIAQNQSFAQIGIGIKPYIHKLLLSLAISHFQLILFVYLDNKLYYFNIKMSYIWFWSFVILCLLQVFLNLIYDFIFYIINFNFLYLYFKNFIKNLQMPIFQYFAKIYRQQTICLFYKNGLKSILVCRFFSHFSVFFKKHWFYNI